jgi:TorA maturation chaperone TorD
MSAPMSGTQPLHFVRTLPPEEQARANFYAVLARLFYAPPDAALLSALAAGGELAAEEPGLAAAWRELVAAAARADPEAVREEYEDAFVGTGKAPITLYSSAYLVRYSNDAPLVALRQELAALGLARRGDVHEPEDHVAGILEVMRHLIAEREDSLDTQRNFFERWVRPAAERLCNAIEKSDKTRFYRSVARLLGEWCKVEHMSFEML